MKKIIANKNDSGQRLDKFIGKIMPSLPKSLMYKGIRKNNVRINGKHCHDEKYIISENDEIILYFSDDFLKATKELKTLPCPEIIYEDENILVINKPAGIPVHSDEKHDTDTLINRVLYYLSEKNEYNSNNENSFTPALCNRLDMNTSGLVIAAKNANALRIINEKIKLKEIKKYYIAIADGIFDKKEDTLISNLVRNNKKVQINDNGIGKNIETHYRVISEKNNRSLLEIELMTGRTHQIRAQLAHIGHPLTGDVKYGSKKNKGGYKLISHKLIFSFSSDACEMNYLNGLIITLPIKAHQDF